MNKNTSPTLDVVITCYNYQDYVGSAIESVLQQTVEANQVIVVDDGSTDSSEAVIAHYGPKIRSIRQKNAGTIAAFERGYEASTGDIVIFLDADDRLLSTAIQEVLGAWKQTASKIQYDLEIIDHDGFTMGRRFCNFPPTYSSKEVQLEFSRTGTYVWPVTSGNAYSRIFLEQVMPMKPPVSYDGVLNTIAPLYGEVITIPFPLGQYRIHGQNISRHNEFGLAQQFPDFARQIGFRKREFAILSGLSLSKGHAIPASNLLDNELVFVNYRLAARRIKQDYIDQEKDTAFRLWRRGVYLALSRGRSFSRAAPHLVWLTLLFIAPTWVSRQLLLLRFNRAQILKPLRKLRTKIFDRKSTINRISNGSG